MFLLVTTVSAQDPQCGSGWMIEPGATEVLSPWLDEDVVHFELFVPTSGLLTLELHGVTAELGLESCSAQRTPLVLQRSPQGWTLGAVDAGLVRFELKLLSKASAQASLSSRFLAAQVRHDEFVVQRNGRQIALRQIEFRRADALKDEIMIDPDPLQAPGVGADLMATYFQVRELAMGLAPAAVSSKLAGLSRPLAVDVAMVTERRAALQETSAQLLHASLQWAAQKDEIMIDPDPLTAPTHPASSAAASTASAPGVSRPGDKDEIMIDPDPLTVPTAPVFSASGALSQQRTKDEIMIDPDPLVGGDLWTATLAIEILDSTASGATRSGATEIATHLGALDWLVRLIWPDTATTPAPVSAMPRLSLLRFGPAE